MKARTLFARVALAASLALPTVGTAFHAEPAVAADPKETFVQAQKLYDERKFAEALPLFREVFEASQSPNARLYVARSLREVGKLAEAYEQMAITVRESTARAETEPKYVPTRDSAAAELAVLEGKVGKIVVALADPPAGAKVLVNASEVPADRLGSPFAVQPGKLVIEATAPGETPVRRELEVSAGEQKTVALVFKADGGASPSPVGTAADPAPPPPDQPTEPAKKSGGMIRNVGYGVTGLGVVGLVVFGITGAMSNGKFADVEACAKPCTDPTITDKIDSGKTLETVANVTLVIGIVGVVAGVGMIVFGGPKEAPAAAGLAPRRRFVSPDIAVSPHGGSLRLTGAF